mmetsp:Transcript_43363/g.127576  ORF Transcript_43363/g.127576 Transcript_43363/m.127576 type:complete len:138 (+) Transcript_43363:943-1356(+)
MSVDRSLDINTTQKGAVPINKYQVFAEAMSTSNTLVHAPAHNSFVELFHNHFLRAILPHPSGALRNATYSVVESIYLHPPQLLGEEKKILDGNLDAVLFAFSRTWLVGAAANHAGVQVGESNNLFLCLQCTAARLRV